MRLMGKRQLGEMQLSELVTTILLSEIAASPIIGKTVGVFEAALSVLVIIALEILIPMLMSKVTFLKRIIVGKPSYIIFKGKLSRKELSKNRVTLEELLSAMRCEGISDISEVEYLFIEPTGKLSFFEKVSSSDNISSAMAHTLMIDGAICPDTLNKLGLTPQKLDIKLKRMGVQRSNVFLLTVDDNGKYNLITRKETDE